MTLAILLAASVSAAAPARPFAEKYLVIVATESSEEAARSRLGSLPPGASVVATDDYEGLKPHLYVVVESAHADARSAQARCGELQKRSVSCYVRRAGAAAASGAVDGAGVDLRAAREIALKASPPRAAVDFAAGVDAGKLAIVAVSYPATRKVHRFLPIERDYATEVFVVRGTEAAPLKGHDLLKPGDRVWEDIQCGPFHLTRLASDPAAPMSLSQRCNEEGTSEFRYVILATARPGDSASGIARWSPSVYPDTPHERFVPNDDPAAPGGLSRRRGDGRSVVEGVEGRKVEGASAFQVRDFTVEWRDGKLVRQDGPWRDAEE